MHLTSQSGQVMFEVLLLAVNCYGYGRYKLTINAVAVVALVLSITIDVLGV